MTDDPLSVADLAEYCRTQAGLLAGRTETIAAETDALLDEIDEDIAAVRDRLSDRSSGPETSATPQSATGASGDDVAELEELEADLEEKQAVAEAKQARMTAFRDLSEAYADLAADLDDADDWRAALGRIVEFERDHDAPAYFEDRQTLLEAAAEAEE